MYELAYTCMSSDGILGSHDHLKFYQLLRSQLLHRYLTDFHGKCACAHGREDKAQMPWTTGPITKSQSTPCVLLVVCSKPRLLLIRPEEVPE